MKFLLHTKNEENNSNIVDFEDSKDNNKAVLDDYNYNNIEEKVNDIPS